MKLNHKLSLFVLVFAFIATSASAQDFYWNSASTRSMALGGAYVPSSSDALGALTTNPAGLTYLTAPSLDLSLSAEFARGSFSNSVNNNAPMTTSPCDKRNVAGRSGHVVGGVGVKVASPQLYGLKVSCVPSRT